MFNTQTRATLNHLAGVVALCLSFATVLVITFGGIVR